MHLGLYLSTCVKIYLFGTVFIEGVIFNKILIQNKNLFLSQYFEISLENKVSVSL